MSKLPVVAFMGLGLGLAGIGRITHSNEYTRIKQEHIDRRFDIHCQYLSTLRHKYHNRCLGYDSYHHAIVHFTKSDTCVSIFKSSEMIQIDKNRNNSIGNPPTSKCVYYRHMKPNDVKVFWSEVEDSLNESN
jgi:hypothetical protein